uniref:tRNA (guanine-N(7)-)-methyltransferase non-catalytic subunit n=1 Tax=Lepeophtheirus salmonis TaxID=72036 RepID=D3PIN5_LEPSM|nr:tRNA -methyltransferase subunit WDR4 [Lepeophtheirus salmonis]
MATLIAHNDFVFVSNGLKFIVMDFKRNTHTVHNIGDSVTPEELKIANENPKILCSELSPCGKFIALGDDFKRLLIWETNGWKLKYQTKVERRINRIAFTPDSQKVVTADKSGDSYLYDILNDKEELILGHLSMLTCIAFNEDGSLMITSDRDEKIRISHFPNAYNIQGFCLGHEDFVTNFKLINKDLLISSSGDGSLRLWKYLEGTQVDVAYPFQDAHIEVNDDDQDAAVIYFSVHEVTDSDSYIIVVLERSPSLVCYKVCDGKLCFTSSIKLPSPPITVTVNNSSSVWTLCQDGLHILELNKGAMKFVGDSVFQELLQTSKDDPFFKDLDGNEGKIEQLRKRIIDNTREYMKRKEERLGKEVEPVVKKTKCNA